MSLRFSFSKSGTHFRQGFVGCTLGMGVRESWTGWVTSLPQVLETGTVEAGCFDVALSTCESTFTTKHSMHHFGDVRVYLLGTFLGNKKVDSFMKTMYTLSRL